MTLRLYYTDSDARTFDAVVVLADVVSGRHEVVLDRTAFYPTSGGQPFDMGRLADAGVIDVFDDDAGRVVHVVTRALAVGAAVRGEIDWPRRLDHMQQHTGQHILSAGFDHRFGVRTVSFHMGAETSTIDLAREVTPAEIAAVEADANRVVWEDRPVNVRFVTEEEAARLPLRKEPARTGTLRLVEIPDCDLSACGGTHVGRTGVVGVIAVAGWERFKGATRLTFVCGGRALRAYGALRDAMAGATRALSVTPGELKSAIERAQQDAKDTQRLVRRLQESLAGYRGAELRTGAETVGAHFALLREEPELDAAGLKMLAAAIVAGSGVIAVLVGRGTPLPVVVARGAGAGIDAAALVRDLTAALGGRGGGTPDLAQAGIPAAPDAVLEFARRTLALSTFPSSGAS